MRYHCFISYTNRESELRQLRPLLDALGAAFRSLGVIHAPFFWDRFELDQQSETRELAIAILEAIRESVCMIALVSPTYVSSPWCTFEWGAMGGIHLSRGPKWPAIRPYIWKGLKDPQHFVGQVPYERVMIDCDVLAKSWLIRNSFEELVYGPERRKFNKFVGDAVGFIAKKYAEIDGMSRKLNPSGKDLHKMSEQLSQGRDIREVASRFTGRRMF